MMSSFSPREIVSELNRYIIGQKDAKRAVAIALRNRWRRQQLDEDMREEVLPKNILMIGPTGVGKTEISRRLAKLANAPFVKVEATKFTEVGYVGRDVEQIVRDLVELAIGMVREENRKKVTAKAELSTEERILDALVGETASAETRQKFRKMLREGQLDDKEIEVEVSDTASSQMPTIDIPGMPGASMGMLNLNDLMGKAFGGRTVKKKMTVKDAGEILLSDEGDKLLDEEAIVREALDKVEQSGIVFIDEIDKIAGGNERRGGEVSREGVQRDLLPLIEGCTVATKYGSVKTDHILFIASGAFSVSKPSDLLPELQGRLPIRVELNALTEADFRHILVEPDYSLIKQYKALLGTEEVTLTFTDDGIDAIAKLSAEVNETVENIGARRLHTVLERILDDISFEATDKPGTEVVVDESYVTEHIGDLTERSDLTKFIL
ncbi:ATP-dependent protease ATPase subunit HslU [Emcibacter nanhaiensis]|uniref:ATP-dependent protease ATPase subunit HslU n=2 Tax=Emcibacter nanhaiensis TaxID=1505037 RepID=A0A501PP12_9PROT|nr:ATP-dependent protease ATPase subunit HslU [Emcibacter nanhaiensis]